MDIRHLMGKVVQTNLNEKIILYDKTTEIMYKDITAVVEDGTIFIDFESEGYVYTEIGGKDGD